MISKTYIYKHAHTQVYCDNGNACVLNVMFCGYFKRTLTVGLTEWFE